MLNTPKHFFDLISIMKIPKICPFSDYIGSKMVKNGLKYFGHGFLRVWHIQKQKKFISDERWDQTDWFGI